MLDEIFESETRNKYGNAMRNFRNNCETVVKIDPNNENLKFIKFRGQKLNSIMPEFWERYKPKNGKTLLCTLIEANEQLEETIRESRAIKMKGLIPEFD